MHSVFTWPVGRDTSHLRPPARSVLSYVLGSALGGLATGTLLGLAGYAVSQTGVAQAYVLLALLPVVLFASVLQSRGVVAPLPERRAQVPRAWLLWRRKEATAFAFGVLIGGGVMTFLRHAVAWSAGLLALAALSVISAALVGLVYGLARSAPLVVTWAQDRAGRERTDWLRLSSPRGILARTLAPLALITYLAALSSSL